jgi:hypothetical protein
MLKPAHPLPFVLADSVQRAGCRAEACDPVGLKIAGRSAHARAESSRTL